MDKSNFKDVYVFIEQRDGKVQNVALELLGKARELADALGEKVVAVMPGYKFTDQAELCIAHAPDQVLVLDEPELDTDPTEP